MQTLDTFNRCTSRRARLFALAASPAPAPAPTSAQHALARELADERAKHATLTERCHALEVEVKHLRLHADAAAAQPVKPSDADDAGVRRLVRKRSTVRGVDASTSTRPDMAVAARSCDDPVAVSSALEAALAALEYEMRCARLEASAKRAQIRTDKAQTQALRAEAALVAATTGKANFWPSAKPTRGLHNVATQLSALFSRAEP
ncbi:hypothetical protein H4R19_004520 [Coemansia spiralis]|nr:hypothetical protein H4R19_004520 [Coemansia spiralis]